MWSPFQIKMILHFHCCHDEFPQANVPIYQSVLSDLIHDGVLIDNDNNTGFTTTDLGKALVEMWCSTPLPVQRFVDPRFEKGSAA